MLHKNNNRLATKEIPDKLLAHHNACRFMPFNKTTGVRQIGVEDFLHRINGSCIKAVLKKKVHSRQ